MNSGTKIISVIHKLIITAFILILVNSCSFQNEKKIKMSKAKTDKITNSVITSTVAPNISKSLSEIKSIEQQPENKEIRIVPNYFLEKQKVKTSSEKSKEKKH
ncbi:MAG: hypothetical protein JKX78_16075 [Alteromonadaceae bacterium]|nr:hypothetical protein [Alteromonadaceae bacterium]